MDKKMCGCVEDTHKHPNDCVSINIHDSTKCYSKTAKRHCLVGTVKDFRCACKCDGLITLDGVVAMKNPKKPHAYVRIVCPQPSVKKCENT